MLDIVSVLRQRGHTVLADHVANAIEKHQNLTPEEIQHIERGRDLARFEQRRQVAIRFSGLSEMDRQKTFENYIPVSCEQASAKDIISRAVDSWPEDRESFYIWGEGNGSGKSHLAKAFANAMIDQYAARIYCVRARSLSRLLSTYYKDARSGAVNPTVQAMQAQIFILDDLDKADIENDKLGVYGTIWEVIDYRVDQKLPFIVTSNYSTDEVKEFISSSLGSRLSSARPLYVTGPDGRSYNGRE